MQVDITQDGVGQADFKLLEQIFSKLEEDSKSEGNHSNSKFKITRNKNDWKFEFNLIIDGFKFVRAKVPYSKTADKLTSCGVS